MVCTAWFWVTRDQAATLAHESILPREGEIRTRLRFYDLRAETPSGVVPFREAVVAFIVDYQGTPGEVSARMLSDSWPYILWGRENFGWPIESAEIVLEGGIWAGQPHDPGSARVVSPPLSIEALVVKEQLPPADRSATWIIPRRHLAREDQGWAEYRDVYALAPTVLASGERFACQGKLNVNSLLDPLDEPTFECAMGIELEVGRPDVLLERKSTPLPGEHLRRATK